MSPFPLSAESYNHIANHLASATRDSVIRHCLEPLICYEKLCISNAIGGDVQGLIELLEAPPLGSEAYSNASSASIFQTIRARVVEDLKREGIWNVPETMALRHFGGIYFSYEQAASLDIILDFIEQENSEKKDTLKAAVLSTASALVNTVGKQFAQPIRPRNKDGSPKLSVVKLIQRDRLLDTFQVFNLWLTRYANLPRGCFPTAALREDYANALEKFGKRFAVIYADPPYTRDHYSRFYHVLETLSLRDDPAVSMVVKQGERQWSRGYYREERHQSPFCIRSTAPAAFDSLFRTARENDAGLVLSYSPHETGDGTHPRVVSTSQIIELANLYYRNVVMTRVDGVAHNQLNRSDLSLKSREHAEIIIKCFR